MIVLPQMIEIQWSKRTKSYYVLKGYNFTYIGDHFKVNVLDLTNGSRNSVNVTCDYCGKEELVEYKAYILRTKDSKYSCNSLDCINKKKKENCVNRHGYEHTSKIPDVKEKQFKTNVEKYGNKCSLRGRAVIEKSKKTLIEKYGVDNPLKSPIIQEKVKETNINKYGVPYLMQNSEIREKAYNTMEELYGVSHALQNKEIQKQAQTNFMNTMYKNGTAPSSKQQRYLNGLLGGELNYPIDIYFLDIAFLNDNTYVEYDGGGHDLIVKHGLSKAQFDSKQYGRYYSLKNLGWKLIRIVSNKDLLPYDDVIIEWISKGKEYLNTKHSWFEINIDESKIKCSQYELFVDFGALRKIKENTGE